MNEEFVVNGYLFATEADALLAKEELEKITYLDTNMNYSNATKVMQLYDSALDNKMFRTPIGWDYLFKLRMILINNGFLEAEIRPVPLSTVFARVAERESVGKQIRSTVKKRDAYKNKYIFTLMLSVALAIAVICMYVIALKSETPNMLNYRNAIVNEYAEWEQDIRERETLVRQKERELNMPSPLPHEEQNTDVITEEGEDNE